MEKIESYSMLKELLLEEKDSDFWVAWVATQINESLYSVQFLSDKLDKLIKTASTSNKMGL